MVLSACQVADIADVVRQRADALMLSGESAAGAYPEKAVGVLRAVATRIEEWCRYFSWLTLPIPKARLRSTLRLGTLIPSGCL